MGTNFYFFTKKKELRDKWFAYGEYELVDEPDFGYEIHIAKTSAGWLPLFQSHKNINSVSDMHNICKDGFEIIDEYNKSYNWEQFEERVLKFNGGVRGAIPKQTYDQSKLPPNLIDRDMPNHTPVSHFEYGGGKYADEYFTDDAGYEFTCRDFT